MDRRWLEPVLTEDSTVRQLEQTGYNLNRITTIINESLMWGSENAPTKENTEVFKTMLAGIHGEEREDNEGTVYDELTIRFIHMSAVYLKEVAEFFTNAARVFIVDFEVENGGDS